MGLGADALDFLSRPMGITGGGTPRRPSSSRYARRKGRADARAGGAAAGGVPDGSAAPAGGSKRLPAIEPVAVDPSLNWSAVGGLEHHIRSLKEMVFLPLLYPEVFAKFHMTPPKGVLFYGPPGTGKTLCARALAASCGNVRVEGTAGAATAAAVGAAAGVTAGAAVATNGAAVAGATAGAATAPGTAVPGEGAAAAAAATGSPGTAADASGAAGDGVIVAGGAPAGVSGARVDMPAASTIAPPLPADSMAVDTSNGAPAVSGAAPVGILAPASGAAPDAPAVTAASAAPVAADAAGHLVPNGYLTGTLPDVLGSDVLANSAGLAAAAASSVALAASGPPGAPAGSAGAPSFTPATGAATTPAPGSASPATPARPRVAFFMRNGADCLSKWVGEAERSLRATFAAAEAHSPAIIFFDEIDGLAPVRSSRQDQIHASIVSTLLGLMDGLEGRGQIVVIGATNRVDAIDPALRRPGRFDRELVFNLPNMAARRSILGIHTRAWTPPPAAPLLDAVAARAVGYCGADLRALCAEAALRALRRRYPQIYDSSAKLAIDAGSLTVRDRDFAAAMGALVPASHRAARTYARPLPLRLATLLVRPLEEAIAVLRRIFSQGLASGVLSAGPAGPEVEEDNAVGLGGGKGIGRVSSASAAVPARQRAGDNGHATSGSESTSDDNADGGYWESESDLGGGGGGDDDVVAAIGGAPGLNLLERATLHPRLLVCGSPGLGQAELGPALLHALEGCPVHAIDLPSLLADPGTQGGDEALASAVREACRAAPAILYIPHMELWWDSSPGILEASLQVALRDIPTTLPLLVLGTCDVPLDQVPLEYVHIFADKISLESPDEELRAAHFEPLLAAAAAVPRSAARRSGVGVGGRRRARPPPPPLPLAVEAPPPPAVSAAAAAAAAAAAVESRRREDEAVLRVLRMEMRALLERLLSDKKLKPYWRPVDPAVAPDYYEIIKRPVDLSLIAANVDRGRYPTVLAMIADFDQMVRNALKYNPPHTEEGAVLIRRANAIVDVVHAWADGLTPALVERCNAIVAARVAAASAAAAAALEAASPSAAVAAPCGGGTTPEGATNGRRERGRGGQHRGRRPCGRCWRS
eukprot:TRINITY_DN2531_c0_g1_i23.p1 TRINITY_DN2531_c0_g1~~TRINITY_DN2531_c0_g1_i23.p1  ORF type:complete len:1273 (-),score=274.31 TRINITY_DN2531_c0_g1_i23:1097-4408(-)